MSIAQYYQAFKQRYVIGWVPQSEQEALKTSASHLWTFKDDNVKVGPARRRRPAEVHRVEGVGAVGHGGDRPGPASALGNSATAMRNVSPEAVASNDAGQDRKGSEIKTSFGETWEQVLRTAALIAGDDAAADDTSSQVRWRDMSTTSPGAIVDALGKIQQMLGVPAEMLWKRIPGWTDQDQQQAVDLIKSGDSLDRLMVTLSKQTQPPDPGHRCRARWRVTAPAQQQTPPTAGRHPGQVATYALGSGGDREGGPAGDPCGAAAGRDQAVARAGQEPAGETWPGWLRAMSLLITNYRGQSSFAAGRSYQAMRERRRCSRPPRAADQAGARPPQEWLDRALGFSGPGMLNKDTAQPGTALSTTLGTAARIALDGGRTTTLDTVKADPAAVGWWRMTDGDPCHFCAMLASRGIVFKEHSFARSDARFIGRGTRRCTTRAAAPWQAGVQPSQQLPHQRRGRAGLA
jgi:hypothetical protein